MNVELELWSILTHVVYDVRTYLGVFDGGAIQLIGQGCKETVACEVLKRVD
jgi:hypothetical protein